MVLATRENLGMANRFAIWNDSNLYAFNVGGDKDRATFRRGVLKVGEYKHPEHGWNLKVTEGDLQKYAETANSAIAAGVKIPVTKDHGKGAEHVVGTVLRAHTEGGWLVLDHEIVGEAGLGLVNQPAVEVSVEIDKDYHDGTGRGYGPAVVASSLVQRPIVPGQGSFERIAASMDGKKAGTIPCTEHLPVLRIAQHSGAPDMKLLQELATKLELGDKVTEENVLELATNKFVELKAQAKDDKKVKELQGKITDLEASLAKTKSVPMDPQYKVLATRLLSQELNTLVEAGKITPAVVEKITPHLSTEIMLGVTKDADAPNYAPILAALAEIKPMPIMGSKTGVQFSLVNPSMEGEGEEDQKKVTEEMIEMANNLKPKKKAG